jgi:hypothetical protein
VDEVAFGHLLHDLLAWGGVGGIAHNGTDRLPRRPDLGRFTNESPAGCRVLRD